MQWAQLFASVTLVGLLPGATQKVKSAKKAMSARLLVEMDGQAVWLTAFTDVMEILMTKTKLSKDATTDEIAAALLELENITLKIGRLDQSKFGGMSLDRLILMKRDLIKKCGQEIIVMGITYKKAFYKRKITIKETST